MRESGGAEAKAGGVEGQPGAKSGDEGKRKQKIQNVQKGDKRFEDEGGVEVQHWQRRARLYSGGIETRRVRGESHSVTSRNTAPGVRVAKTSEFGEGKL